MGLCDWQCISRGHWARDLAYAICHHADRWRTVESWERELVARYVGPHCQSKTAPVRHGFDGAFAALPRRSCPPRFADVDHHALPTAHHAGHAADRDVAWRWSSV